MARALGADPLTPLVPAALAALLADGSIVRDGFCLRKPEHRARLSDADRLLLDRVSAQLQAAGLRPPIVGDLAVALDTPLPALLGELVSLARRGHLVQVAKNRFSCRPQFTHSATLPPCSRTKPARAASTPPPTATAAASVAT
jgi:selenocysteine-specific elongation factor